MNWGLGGEKNCLAEGISFSDITAPPVKLTPTPPKKTHTGWVVRHGLLVAAVLRLPELPDPGRGARRALGGCKRD